MGWDHEFLVHADMTQWLLDRFARRLRRQWPRLVVGIGMELLAPQGQFPPTFPEFVDLSKDSEMQAWTEQRGAVSTPEGECSIGILQLPREGGLMDLDFILAEPRAHPFTQRVLGLMCAVLVDAYRRERWAALKAERKASPRGAFVLEAPVNPAWMVRAARACARKRWPGCIFTHEGAVQGHYALTVRHPETGEEATFSFGPAGGERSGARLSASVPPGSSRNWRGEVRTTLEEAVGLWHFVSYRSMRPLLVFSWPPGEPVCRGSVVEFGGWGGSFPAARTQSAS